MLQNLRLGFISEERCDNIPADPGATGTCSQTASNFGLHGALQRQVSTGARRLELGRTSSSAVSNSGPGDDKVERAEKM
ncbi:hypothetical protein ACEPAI_9955 [Sanghuangporus weigelae]